MHRDRMAGWRSWSVIYPLFEGGSCGEEFLSDIIKKERRNNAESRPPCGSG